MKPMLFLSTPRMRVASGGTSIYPLLEGWVSFRADLVALEKRLISCQYREPKHDYALLAHTKWYTQRLC